DGLAATSNVTVRTNSVFVGGDAGSQVNLVNSNTFTGGLTINANATLEAQHAHALGATNTGSTVSSGGTLKLYSIAGISFAHEALLLYGTGVGATNGALRNVGGNNVWNGAITLGSSVRINADTTGGAGSLTLAGSVDGGNNTLYVGAAGGTNGGNVTIAGTIGGGGGLDSGVVTSLYKDGAGTLTLSGANNFTGATRIATGTLSLSATGGNAALGSTAAVRVDTGATLLLSASSQLSDAASITLSGGTIARAGGVDEVFGNLNLTTSSFLDYGSGEAGSLRFGTYSPSALLTVQNFFAGNKLQFASTLSGAQLADPSLFSFSNSFTTGTEGGFFTITAIPEPSASFAAAALLAMM
ncbi:MAG: autotransporter-associated beta strand repeat-containing protein, partial [Chthoniobacterales bacterium]